MINLTQGRRLQARDLQHTLKSFNTLKTGSAAERERQRQAARRHGRAGQAAWLLFFSVHRQQRVGFPLEASTRLTSPHRASLPPFPAGGCSLWPCSQRGFWGWGAWGPWGNPWAAASSLGAGDRDDLGRAFTSLAQSYR